MVLTPSSILILVLVPLVGFLAAKWLFQKDTEIENRRRGAAKVAAVLQTYGQGIRIGMAARLVFAQREPLGMLPAVPLPPAVEPVSGGRLRVHASHAMPSQKHPQRLGVALEHLAAEPKPSVPGASLAWLSMKRRVRDQASSWKRRPGALVLSTEASWIVLVLHLGRIWGMGVVEPLVPRFPSW